MGLKYFLNVITLVMASTSVLSCGPKKKNNKSSVSETILYQFNGTIWEYDVSQDQSTPTISLHGEEDSAVYDKLKNNIIFDTFNPASSTKSHNLYSTAYPIGLNHSHLYGSAHISAGDPSFLSLIHI